MTFASKVTAETLAQSVVKTVPKEKKFVRWVNGNPGNDPSERGYWESAEGRFYIGPNFRHTVYPDSYTVTDRITKKEGHYDTVRECKEWAENVVVVHHQQNV